MMIAPFPALTTAAADTAVGVVLGLAYFNLLRWNLRLYFVAPARAIGLQALRLAALAAVFVLLARLGAWPLLLALAGVMIGRGLVLHRVRGT